MASNKTPTPTTNTSARRSRPTSSSSLQAGSKTKYSNNRSSFCSLSSSSSTTWSSDGTSREHNTYAIERKREFDYEVGVHVKQGDVITTINSRNPGLSVVGSVPVFFIIMSLKAAPRGLD
ncbi:hypothetical protein OIDMADRAFT_146395 [Oidiodendron maius Zn]|uniref:Uncharacterized protein n=1 Tax=Oidiodendron maius (strain Zn) TaxID=913774 RepID=A0A0C3HBU3_OIDMZ|nr:hypothetical protein OIDMADRAFT_146395 [Oidiodendron maius Zn]